jgi:hypothetical protein
LPAKIFAPVEVAAGLWPVGVDGTKERGGIEGHAGPIAALVHAAHAIVFGDELFRHGIARPQFHHEVAAAAAAGAGRKVGMSVDGPRRQVAGVLAMTDSPTSGTIFT